MSILKLEPTVIIQAINTALQAINWAAVNMSTGAHIAVTVLLAVISIIANRAAVTPVAAVAKTP